MAGQSNASGFMGNNQTYTGGPSCHLFGNDYKWHQCYDPSDDPTNQVDTVSKETTLSGGRGSYWLPMLSLIADHLGVPVAMVPAALGGTSSAQWQPGAGHFDRATLFGSMLYRAQLTGARTVLWHQGEGDAAAGVSQATYNANLDTIANTLFSELGIKLVVPRLQDCTGIADVFEDNVDNAILQAYGDNANVLTGPNLRGSITSEDDFHVLSDALGATVAGMWATSLYAAFGW